MAATASMKNQMGAFGEPDPDRLPFARRALAAERPGLAVRPLGAGRPPAHCQRHHLQRARRAGAAVPGRREDARLLPGVDRRARRGAEHHRAELHGPAVLRPDRLPPRGARRARHHVQMQRAFDVFKQLPLPADSHDAGLAPDRRPSRPKPRPRRRSRRVPQAAQRRRAAKARPCRRQSGPSCVWSPRRRRAHAPHASPRRPAERATRSRTRPSPCRVPTSSSIPGSRVPARAFGTGRVHGHSAARAGPGRLAEQAGAHRRALRARRHHRPDGAHRRRAVEPDLQADLRGREQGRRRRQPRRRRSGQGRARRLHLPDGHAGHAGDQPVPVPEDALRHRQGPGAGVLRRARAERADGQPAAAGEEHQGADRAGSRPSRASCPTARRATAPPATCRPSCSRRRRASSSRTSPTAAAGRCCRT